MNSNTMRLLAGTVTLSLLILGSCFFVVLKFPAAEKETIVSQNSKFDEFNELLAEDFFFGTKGSSNFKTDYSDDYSPEEDRGLALYRQPQSRPAVEWFYTHIVSSREVALAILENADKNDIPLTLAFSLAYVESRYKPNAVNKNSNYTIDRGLFQLNSSSFPKLTEEEFFDPKISAKYGMSHLRYCMDVAGNDITALAMYNAGTARVKSNNTPQHTLNYVAKISDYRGKLEGMFSSEVLSFYEGTASVSSKALAMAK